MRSPRTRREAQPPGPPAGRWKPPPLNETTSSDGGRGLGGAAGTPSPAEPLCDLCKLLLKVTHTWQRRSCNWYILLATVLFFPNYLGSVFRRKPSLFSLVERGKKPGSGGAQSCARRVRAAQAAPQRPRGATPTWLRDGVGAPEPPAVPGGPRPLGASHLGADCAAAPHPGVRGTETHPRLGGGARRIRTW